ncbi:MAG: hypothetical protein JW787_14050 [Sedimentisphaerales bacterium]|nr:hypothetical protein [Sedimentisphaerales bacterium]
MGSLSDTVLTNWNIFLQWLAIGGTAVGLLSVIGLFVVNSEIGRRADLKLKDAQQKIEIPKPLPVQSRVRNFLNSINRQILIEAKAGKDVCRLSLNFGQAGDLLKLTQEDVDGDYIINIPNTNFIMNQPGMAGEFIIKIGSKLLENQ